MISEEVIRALNVQLPRPMRVERELDLVRIRVSNDWFTYLWPLAGDDELIAQAEDMASELIHSEWKFKP